jgi:hypothetical protein
MASSVGEGSEQQPGGLADGCSSSEPCVMRHGMAVLDGPACSSQGIREWGTKDRGPGHVNDGVQWRWEQHAHHDDGPGGRVVGLRQPSAAADEESLGPWSHGRRRRESRGWVGFGEGMGVGIVKRRLETSCRQVGRQNCRLTAILAAPSDLDPTWTVRKLAAKISKT